MFSYRLYRFASWLRYIVPRRFTPAGLLALALLVCTGALGAEMDQTLAHQLFALVLAATGVAMVSVNFFRGRFIVRRVLPRFGSVAEPLSYHVVVRNDSPRDFAGLEVLEELADPRPTRAEFQRRRAGVLPAVLRRLKRGRRRAEPETQRTGSPNVRLHTSAATPLPPLRSRAEASARLELTPLRRGVLRFQAVIVARPDPLGFVRAFRRQPLPQTVLVLPKRYPLPHITLPGARTYQRGGVAMASAIGESEEFVSLRDYRPGDPLRHVHWRSWARHGRPIVKEFQDEFLVRHALVLDTFADTSNSAAFEEAVSVAASFVCTVDTQENLLDLLFAGTRAICVTTGRGVAQAEQALEALAAVQPVADGNFETLEEFVLRHSGAVCGCVCVLLDWDEPRRRLVRKLQARGLPVVVLLIAPATGDANGAITGRTEHFHVLKPGTIAADLQRFAATLS